eukprot:TRINITY_DN4691_c0_g1_i23.p1 TRINITY_DN4691_c0_g1~~TRINITY_DN4691_c0_g1_i23.p1  ORF type:complete len:228 (-),score=26.72 TRINITY_DN4691_c0_g1_i23:578-1261(-)
MEKMTGEHIEYVFFDMETTGFQEPIRPVQIGAVDSWGKRKFNKFLLPDREIEHYAIRRHGFTKDNGTLCCRHGCALDAMDMKWGLIEFVEWLKSFGGKVVLIAHNCRNFDARILLKNFKEFHVPHEDVIVGFSDSLVASRFYFPGNEISHSLPDMLVNVDLRRQETQDALENAMICRRIVKRMAAQNKRKFVHFVCNPKWYKTLDQQNKWTFAPRTPRGPTPRAQRN